MEYIVHVKTLPAYPWDETIEAEYTGIRHKTRKAAEKERHTAQKEPGIHSAWIIEEQEDTMQETATRLLQDLEQDKTGWKYPWMKDICRLAAEYMSLDGLEDARRAADIPDEIIDIINNIN